VRHVREELQRAVEQHARVAASRLARSDCAEGSLLKGRAGARLFRALDHLARDVDAEVAHTTPQVRVQDTITTADVEHCRSASFGRRVIDRAGDEAQLARDLCRRRRRVHGHEGRDAIPREPEEQLVCGRHRCDHRLRVALQRDQPGEGVGISSVDTLCALREKQRLRAIQVATRAREVGGGLGAERRRWTRLRFAGRPKPAAPAASANGICVRREEQDAGRSHHPSILAPFGCAEPLLVKMPKLLAQL
jgi:hypothetical protein